MKVLIPSHSLEFTGEVQQVLLLADQQGFDVSNIELGVSSAQYIELVDSNTSRISTNLFPQHWGSNDQKSLVFIYGQDNQLDTDKNAQCGVVHVGLELSTSTADRWFHNGVETLLTDTKPLSLDQSWRHLAWVVASLALDFPLEDCLVLSRAALNVSRETWPTQFETFPQILQPSTTHVDGYKFDVISKESLGLYPVVGSVAWVQRLLALGINTIQLRIKDPDRADLEQQIVEAIKLGRDYNAQVFINDYWKLAVKHKAFGVHLGQEDVVDADLSLIANSGLKLGISTHGYFELLRIHQLAPSYIALGHIFPTTTKQMPSKPQGLVRLRLYQTLLDSMPYANGYGVPSVAIGGIDLQNIDNVLEQGVSSIAVVRAITESSNVPLSASKLLDKIIRHVDIKREVSNAN